VRGDASDAVKPKPVRRRLFTAFSVPSLILFAAASGSWTRNYSIADEITGVA
jgi:hypothetical protein